mgnify:CR=1 FL=1|jgi:hypothetical protein
MYINYSAKNYTSVTYNLTFPAIMAKSNHENNNDANLSNQRFLILDSARKTIYVYNNIGMVKNITMNDTYISDMCL